MQEELEQREEAFKKSKSNAEEKRKQQHEADRIKEEGRKMREEAIAKAEEEEAARQKANAPPSVPESSDTKLDTTVRIKYSLSSHPGLDSSTALSTHLKENRFTNFDERTIVLSLRPAKGKKNKSAAVPIMTATALVPFNTVMDAFSLVCASGSEKRGLKDVQVTWASGVEPAVVANLKNHTNPPKEQPKSFSFSSTVCLQPGN
jgi:DnaJ family protein C protein 17